MGSEAAGAAIVPMQAAPATPAPAHVPDQPSPSALSSLAVVPAAPLDSASPPPLPPQDSVGDDIMPVTTQRRQGSAGTCWFECGTVTGLYNISSAAYPKLCCGLCRSSKKSFDAQARLSPAYRIMLEDMKRNKQQEYKAKVRAGRLIPGGPDSASARSQAEAEYAAELEIESAVSDAGRVLWPTRNEYIGYSMTFRNMTAEAAGSEFDQKLRNPDIKPRGTANDPRVPLEGIPETTGSVTRRFKRQIKVSAGIGNQEQLQIALGRVQVGQLPQMSSGQFGDVGGQVFMPGAAGSSTDSGAILSLPPPTGQRLALGFDDVTSVGLAPRQTAAASGRKLQERPSANEEEEASAQDPRTKRQSNMNISRRYLASVWLVSRRCPVGV